MYRNLASVFSVLVGALAVAVPTPSPAAPPTIYDLGTLGGRTSSASAINNHGQIVGASSFDPVNTARHAFLYTGTPGSGGTIFDLGSLVTDEWTHGSGASDVNDSGQIVGTSDITGNVAGHGFIYTGTPGVDGKMMDLGTLPGHTNSSAAAINEAGQITGSSWHQDITHYRAFSYTGTPGDGGAMADLGTLGGNSSFGRGINNLGQVVGSSWTTGENGRLHAFIYTGSPGSGGTMTDLGTLPGGTLSDAYAINDRGQVTGYAHVNAAFDSHAFLYTGTPGNGGKMFDLGALPGANTSFGYAINAGGQVVGDSYTTAYGLSHAFLYTGIPGLSGHMIDLDAWLDANNPTEGAKWTLGVAYGISDSGLIIGAGNYDGDLGNSHAFLLDASSLIPEPSSLALLALATMCRRGRSRPPTSPLQTSH